MSPPDRCVGYRYGRLVRLGAAALLWLVGALQPGGAQAQAPASWSAVVTYVVDGDTVWVRAHDGSKPLSVRMEGIDAPEICQAGGVASREALRQRLQGQVVVVHGLRHDDYGRLLARIDQRGEDVGAWMVRTGHAWSYHAGRRAGPYAAEQRQARAARAGLFAQQHPAPVYPGRFRREHGSCHVHKTH